MTVVVINTKKLSLLALWSQTSDVSSDVAPECAGAFCFLCYSFGVIIDGRQIAEDIVLSLLGERSTLPPIIKLGVLMGAGDKATESFVRIKEKIADRLGVVIVREVLSQGATTLDALLALKRLSGAVDGIVIQLPLPATVDTEDILATVAPEQDVDAIGPGPRAVRAPVAEAVLEILLRAQVEIKDKKAVVVGAGKLVGEPAAKLFNELGARLQVVTLEQGSLDQLKGADIIVSGAGKPGLLKPEMLKPGVVLIDAGTSESGGKLAGDADPACAEVASVFTPVPGGVGPIAVAMLFKNLFALLRGTPLPK